MAIVDKVAQISNVLNRIPITIGRAEICLDKSVIQEPNLSIVNDKLNDIDALLDSLKGMIHGEGGLGELMQAVEDALA
jgi:hypothetical protein